MFLTVGGLCEISEFLIQNQYNIFRVLLPKDDITNMLYKNTLCDVLYFGSKSRLFRI